jgi:hypothetical protein
MQRSRAFKSANAALRLFLNCNNVIIPPPLQCQIEFQKKKQKGEMWRVWRVWDNSNEVFSQKLVHRTVSRSTVMSQKQISAILLWPFLLCIFRQMAQKCWFTIGPCEMNFRSTIPRWRGGSAYSSYLYMLRSFHTDSHVRWFKYTNVSETDSISIITVLIWGHWNGALNHTIQLSAQKGFTKFCCCDSLKTASLTGNEPVRSSSSAQKTGSSSDKTAAVF